MADGRKKPRTKAQLSATARMVAKRRELANSGALSWGRSPSLATLQKRADKDAREKFLAFASTHVLPVGDALVKKATEGDTQAIKEFFDRVFGKAPQAIEVDVTHHFKLRATNQAADALIAPQPMTRIIEHGVTHANDDAKE